MSEDQIQRILDSLERLSIRMECMERAQADLQAALLGKLANGGAGLMARCQMHQSTTSALSERVSAVEGKVEKLVSVQWTQRGVILATSTIASIFAWIASRWLAK